VRRARTRRPRRHSDGAGDAESEGEARRSGAGRETRLTGEENCASGEEIVRRAKKSCVGRFLGEERGVLTRRPGWSGGGGRSSRWARARRAGRAGLQRPLGELGWARALRAGLATLHARGREIGLGAEGRAAAGACARAGGSRARRWAGAGAGPSGVGALGCDARGRELARGWRGGERPGAGPRAELAHEGGLARVG
jgi:hypothetical protein